MAWIKMRTDLRNDPTVFRLAKAAKLDRLSVVGRLFALWAWIDQHAVDGRVDGAEMADVDDICERKGFAQALVSVGWLEVGDGFVTLPNYDRHNGDTAKERSLKNARQARWRDGKASTSPSTSASTEPPTGGDGGESTPPSTREDKRREELLTTPPQEGRGVTRKARATSLPSDFGISPGIREWAEREGFAPYLDAHLAHFLDYAAAKRPTYVDWDAAFRNAIRADWGDVRKTAMRTPTTGDAAVAAYLARYPDATH